jgi:hypothetical protein
MEFSLFYFSGDGSTTRNDKYRLLIEGAKFADRHRFSGVWIPERHFDAFGGLYPNPSVAGAAISMITEHIQIRSGSVVMPLQNPLRVAEEWSMVDNLSNGRVSLSFAPGWHPNDFVLYPKKRLCGRISRPYKSYGREKQSCFQVEITALSALTHFRNRCKNASPSGLLHSLMRALLQQAKLGRTFSLRRFTIA